MEERKGISVKTSTIVLDDPDCDAFHTPEYRASVERWFETIRKHSPEAFREMYFGEFNPETKMEMHKCDSSNITQYGYDKENQHLVVHFKSGGQYRYKAVTQDAFDQFHSATSKGGHFHKNIRGTYEHEPIN